MKISILIVSLLVISASSQKLDKGSKVTCVPNGNCFLPDCVCSSIEHPDPSIPLDQVPQMVFLTFDDSVNIENYQLFTNIFDGRVNPNGAPISGTFFVSHEYSNYSLINSLYRKGHEIGLHSISHTSDAHYWINLDEAGWTLEATDQISQMAKFAKIPAADLIGFRAPYLNGGGDTMYKVLAKNFLYDSSRQSRSYRLWPYSAEFDSIDDCQISHCPIGSYPGFWVAPLIDLIGSNGYPCLYIETCLDIPINADEVYELLMRNFNDHYTGNKAPFEVRVHAAWLQHPDRPYMIQGYLKFLDEILAQPKKDIFVVSIRKGFDWLRNPQALANVDQNPSWQPPTPPTNNCVVSFNCLYSGTQLPPEISGERMMNSCVSCPPNYPWVSNPLGA